MRRVAIVTVFCLLAGLFAGRAEACIAFDRPAEMRLIVDAIDSPSTPTADKAELKTLQAKLVALSGNTDSPSVGEYSITMTKALKLIGKERIVARPTTETASGPLPQSASRGCG